MPIYEYACNSCHQEFELFQKITEDPAEECPKCGSNGVQRLISRTSFILKGTGWYVTDYGGKKPHDSAEPKDHSTSDSKKKSDKPSADKADKAEKAEKSS